MSREDTLNIVRREDLAASGLGRPSIIRKLQVSKMLTRQQTAAATGVEDAVSYEIPYFGPRGEDLKYRRWKLIPLTDDVGIKYYQDEKTIPKLYLPPLVDWLPICADTSRRLIITEGEKKAACATLMGMPCISVGGVWSWKSKKWNLSTLPDFDWFEWKDRDVEVCYDGDMYTNDNVAKALDALTNMLTRRGARVYVRYLPNVEGLSKLDDFLVQRSVAEYEKLECCEAPNSVEMSRLNDDLVYVKNIKSYFSTYERHLYGDLRSLRRRYGSTKIVSDNGRPISAVDEWVQWPHMRMADKMTYAPGAGLFVDGALNDWRGWGVRPKRGSSKLFLDLIRSLEGWEWFLQWLAYPIQNPGTKLFSSVLLWSVEQGTGKTFIGDVMRDIYGENSNVITSVDLHDDSFVWMRNMQFILGEEVSQTRSRADAGILKHIITGDTVTVNEKYVPSFHLPNCANFMFTSNKPDAIILDRGDRRFFVSKLDKKRPQKFWNELDRWRKREGGPGFFMHYLQNNVDCSKFNPRAMPPETSEKEMMKSAGLTSVQQWVSELMEDPVGVISEKFDEEIARSTMRRDVFSVAQILNWLPDDLRLTNRVQLSNALTMLGAIRNSSPVRLDRGKQLRLVAIQNMDYWRERVGVNREWAANYEKKLTPIKKADKRRRK